MLRLKQAMHDCGIPQKELCRLTGFGKTQISITLSSGKLPADAEKFIAGVRALVSAHGTLDIWLTEHQMQADHLLETIQIPSPVGSPLSERGVGGDLEAQLYTLAGRATLDGGISGKTALRLIRALHFLALVTPATRCADAAAILAGGEA